MLKTLLIMTLLVLTAGFGFADVVSVPELIGTNGPGGICFGAAISGCVPYAIQVPQFDPALGTLLAIDFAYTDSQFVGWGWNDQGAPVGVPFQVTVSSDNRCDFFGGGTASTTYDLITTGTHHISGSGGGSSFSLANSSSFFDSSFIGTGFVTSNCVSRASVQSSLIVPFAALTTERDFARLDLSYIYSPTNAVAPEPRYLAAVLALLVIVTRLTVLFKRS